MPASAAQASTLKCCANARSSGKATASTSAARFKAVATRLRLPVVQFAQLARFATRLALCAGFVAEFLPLQVGTVGRCVAQGIRHRLCAAGQRGRLQQHLHRLSPTLPQGQHRHHRQRCGGARLCVQRSSGNVGPGASAWLSASARCPA
jgi:hypothetical protein